jgi:hypothetical protein
MLRQPADAAPPLGRPSDAGGILSFRRTLSDWNAASSTRSLRAWAGRVSGRSDRRLLLALAGATEALVASCDQLVDRLTTQETVTADIADSFGREIVLLRAEVVQLQRSVDERRGTES